MVTFSHGATAMMAPLWFASWATALSSTGTSTNDYFHARSPQSLDVPRFRWDRPRLPRQYLAAADDPLNPFGFLTGTEDNDSAVTEATDTGDTSTTIHTKHISTSTSVTSSLAGTRTTSSGTMTDSATAALATSSTVRTNPDSLTSSTTASASSSAAPAQTYASSDPGPDSWKIIGIGVLAFTGVAIIILGVTFFDSWWSTFLRPIVLGKDKNRHGKEELIPDWERRSWRIGIEEKDDRYPSVASLPSILRMGDGKEGGRALYGGGCAAVMPEHRSPDDEASPYLSNNLNFPMPPTKAPFPLHRQPSNSKHVPTSGVSNTPGSTPLPSVQSSPTVTLERKESLKKPNQVHIVPTSNRGIVANTNGISGPLNCGSGGVPTATRRKASLKGQKTENEVAYGHSPEDYY